MDIHVEDAAGVKQGDGPIITATDWQSGPALDRAGSFSFRMPASDPRAALLVPRLRVRAILYEALAAVELGYGIIEQIDTDINAPEMLAVSGADQLRELADISVRDLVLSELDTPNAASVENVPPGGGVTLPFNFDLGWESYIYVNHATAYESITFTMGTQVNRTEDQIAGAASLWELQYFNGDTQAWEQLPVIKDGDTTRPGGTLRTLGQSGTITFDPPAAWDDTETGSYTVRMRTMDAAISVDVNAVTCNSTGPIDDALSTLMALAPAGWTVRSTSPGHAETLGTFMQTCAGESLLTMLTMLAERLGEHFYAVGRELIWLQKDQPASGMRALTDVDPAAIEADADVALLTGLSERQDAASIYSRIYPFGGGVGDKRVTLEFTDRTLPAGYSYVEEAGVKVGIKLDACEVWAGRIDQGRESKSEISARAGTESQKRNAANSLCDWAVEWLRTHSAASVADVPRFYAAGLVHVRTALYPGHTIRVDVQRYRDGTRYLNVAADLVILSKTEAWTPDGRQISVELGTVDRWPAGDVLTLVKELQQAEAARSHNPSPVGQTFIGNGVACGLVVRDGAVQSFTAQTGRTEEVESGQNPDDTEQRVYLYFVNGIYQWSRVE